MKQKQTLTTHNTNLHCSLCFYTFVGQSLLKQLYVKSQSTAVLPVEKFLSLVLPRNVKVLKHLIIQFALYYLRSGRFQEVKNQRKFENRPATRVRHIKSIKIFLVENVG